MGQSNNVPVYNNLMYFKRFLVLFILVLCFISYAPFAHAADYKTDYTVEYYVQDQNNSIRTNVDFNIRITNLRSDVYVNKFSISFPESFAIHNLSARDDHGSINTELTTNNRLNTIATEFSKPNTGRNSVNTLYLQFSQDNLFQIQGNVWEVILPTIENRTDATYTAIIHLPHNTDKKISIAKPDPTTVQGDTITWVNPPTRTIYAVFGDQQYYNLNLTYHIKNPKIIPVYTEVAFPPDMLHQKVVIGSINPKPVQTYTDDDGNFLGKYLLAPKQTLTIQYQGTAEIFANPREDFRKTMKSLFTDGKKYLLTQQKYWILSDVTPIKNYSTPNQIYRFVTNSLHYDYSRAASNNTRLGAQPVLINPNKAVCVEFSDLFIASSREKGIFSREIEGYGYSSDSKLRPLSLVSDVLHSWPEFYNQQENQWQSVDPTWENTSGIDYFNSFDLDHIAFVIHGSRSDYPLAAGMYKLENSHDVSVSFTTQSPREQHNLMIDTSQIPTKLLDNSESDTQITLVNNGNVSEMNTTIRISSPNLAIIPSERFVPMIVPYESKTIAIHVKPMVKNKHIDSSVEIYANSILVASKSVSIIPFVYELSLKIAGVVASVFLAFLIIRIVIKRRHA